MSQSIGGSIKNSLSGDHLGFTILIQLRDLFQIGPLHPFIQLLADGELFHAHTKIATKNSDENRNRREGYFMKSNKESIDPIGYITVPSMTPEELEKRFLSLCEKGSHIFLYNPIDNFCKNEVPFRAGSD